MRVPYNSIGRVTDSNWIPDDLRKEGYSHFIIYFDDYGTYDRPFAEK
jgi:hypothetical protein